MGPEDTPAHLGTFSDRIPPVFNGRSDYASYHEDALLWVNLTSLPSTKHGPALVGRLSEEAKASARTLSIEELCSEEGVDLLLEHLDKSFAVDPANQLDSDLATFLDFTWKKTMTVEQYIAGFHSRLDRISSLKMDNKLKGHLLLRQASLETQEKNMVIGAESGNHDITYLSSALRNAYVNHLPSSSTMNTTIPNSRPPSETDLTVNANLNRSKTSRRSDRNRRVNTAAQSQNNPDSSIATGARPVFFTYKTDSSTNNTSGAIVDSGACSSVVGKTTLDKTLKLLNIDNLPNGPALREHHRFGDYSVNHKALCSVKMPFDCIGENGQEDSAFDIMFDVIEGNLPFLVGLPSLLLMEANLNFKHRKISFFVNSKLTRLELLLDDDHIILPFKPKIKMLIDKSQPRKQGHSYVSSS